MKYIKHINETSNFQRKKYWLIPTDERYEDSLRKIAYDKIDTDYDTFPTIHSNDYMYVLCFQENEHGRKNWGWNRYPSNNWEEEHGYVYQGAVNLSDVELASMKYNL